MRSKSYAMIYKKLGKKSLSLIQNKTNINKGIRNNLLHQQNKFFCIKSVSAYLLWLELIRLLKWLLRGKQNWDIRFGFTGPNLNFLFLISVW